MNLESSEALRALKLSDGPQPPESATKLVTVLSGSLFTIRVAGWQAQHIFGGRQNGVDGLNQTSDFFYLYARWSCKTVCSVQTGVLMGERRLSSAAFRTF